jgi:hypothetical protein
MTSGLQGFLACLGSKRVALPLGAAGVLASVGTAVIIMASGQAVGPVLSGSVTGDVVTVVSETIILDPDLLVGFNPVVVSGVDDWASTRNDEGTQFNLAMEMNVGDRAIIDIYLENLSNRDAAATFSVVAPADVDVELTEIPTSDDRVAEAQMSRARWLMRLSAAAGDDDEDGIRLTVEPKDQFKPGFFVVNALIAQIEG